MTVSRPILLVLLLATPAARAGDLRGTVRYGGPEAKAAARQVGKDREACGSSVLDESLLTAGGRLANAVVQVRGVPGPPPAPMRGSLDQVRCRFTPRVQALPRGSTLDIATSDAVLHSVHGWIGRATAFNHAQSMPGERAAQVLERPGIIQVRCDVHDWMTAWIVVTEGPAAVTGADGSFLVRDLPAGSYTVVFWHERLGERAATVAVPASGTATLDASY